MGIGDTDRLSNLPKVMPDTCARAENWTLISGVPAPVFTHVGES